LTHQLQVWNNIGDCEAPHAVSEDFMVFVEV
jgi:hypothetical protein